eukprot:4216745-Amphidinium_carterae.1
MVGCQNFRGAKGQWSNNRLGPWGINTVTTCFQEAGSSSRTIGLYARYGMQSAPIAVLGTCSMTAVKSDVFKSTRQSMHGTHTRGHFQLCYAIHVLAPVTCPQVIRKSTSGRRSTVNGHPQAKTKYKHSKDWNGSESCDSQLWGAL